MANPDAPVPVGASEPLLLRDDFGDAIEIGVDEFLATTPDGSISPARAIFISFRCGDRRLSMRLSGDRLAAFREAVDRHAMPGQPGAEASDGR